MRSPAQPEWTPERIKCELRQRLGKTLAAISVEWGYGAAAISHALRRHGYSVPVERRVAEALGIPAHVLWPSRWSVDGVPLPLASDHQAIERRRVRTSQIGRAA